MIHFREYLEKIEEYATGNTIGTHNDGPGSGFPGAGGMAYLPSHWTNTETLQNKLASLDGVVKTSLDKLDLNQGRMPLVKRDSRVMYMRKEDNPIYVHLEDGTKLYFSRGQWQRAGEPETGRRVVLTMQRRSNDSSDQTSQIHSIRTI